MLMFRLLIPFIVFIFSTAAQSAVNTRNGSYTEYWIDFIEPGDGYEMKVERAYSSRSLFIGIFGFGWCSEYETHLSITSDGIINLTECGGGLEVTYYPEKFEVEDVTKTIDRIVEHIKKSQKMTTNDIQNLKVQLKANSKMRFEYANKLHLVDVNKLKTMKNVFYAKSKGVEKIVFDGKTYSRKKFDGSVERFDKKGKLIQLVNPTGQWVKLNYKGNKLVFLVDNKGRRINFAYDNNGRLKKLYNGSGLVATYEFQSDNLVSMKNIWEKTYKYKYDSNHNLTEALFPDGSTINMSYDLANDWIKTYSNRIGCREDYDFTMSPQDPKNHYWATYKRTCKNGTPISGRHEFWYKTYSFSEDKYLNRALEKQDEDFKDIYFHPYLGRATSINENFSYMGFAYYLNGLLNKQEYKQYDKKREIKAWNKSSFKYNLQNFKINEILKAELNAAGKTIKTEKSYLTYNNRGLLIKVKSDNGQSVSISYGQNGRVASLKNQDNTEITLNYENGSNKPSSISQTGLGQVLITYDNQGEVSKVEVPNKRNIATSVIESFLSMIELLGPMGQSLKI